MNNQITLADKIVLPSYSVPVVPALIAQRPTPTKGPSKAHALNDPHSETPATAQRQPLNPVAGMET